MFAFLQINSCMTGWGRIATVATVLCHAQIRGLPGQLYLSSQESIIKSMIQITVKLELSMSDLLCLLQHQLQFTNSIQYRVKTTSPAIITAE